MKGLRYLYIDAMKLLCALVSASLGSALITAAPVTTSESTAFAARADSVYVPILVYHGVFPHHAGQTPEQIEYDVAPERFDEQMAYLKDNGYRVISLVTLVDALEKGDTLPAKSVVITLDDGSANQYVHAFPILKKYGYTATFFVYPAPIVGGHSGFMTFDQLREMQKAGMTIESHTRTHPKLTAIKNVKGVDGFEWQFKGSRTVLEKELGTTVDIVAFPFGLHNALSDSVMKAVGYRAARGFPVGGWNSKATIFALRAFEITDNMRSFKAKLDPTPPKPAVRK